MKLLQGRSAPVALAAAVAVGLCLGLYLSQPSAGLAQKAPDMTGPRYTVVFTEGTNLCVTDNKTNTVYYYTVDPEKEPGAELKLRGSLNLNQVGQPVIQPRLTKKQNRD